MKTFRINILPVNQKVDFEVVGSPETSQTSNSSLHYNLEDLHTFQQRKSKCIIVDQSLRGTFSAIVEPIVNDSPQVI